MRALQACTAWMQGLGSLMQPAAGAKTTAAIQQQCLQFVRQRSMAAPAGMLILQHQVSAALNQQQSFSGSSSGCGSRLFSSHTRGLHAPLQPRLQQQQPFLSCQPGTGLLCPFRPQQQQQLLQPQFGSSIRHFVMQPRRVKYRKAHKSQGFNETICPNTRQLAFGLYGVRAMEHCRMPAKTIEAARRTLRRTITKTAMLWVRVTPNVPVTSKPAEVRMGKGKGTLDYWAAPIRPGQIIFEIDRCTKMEALAAVKSIEAKMPIKVGFVEWN